MTQINVTLKVGRLKMNIDCEELPKGTCKNCGQLIYWLKILSNKNKIQLSKNRKGEYTAHSLVCPTVLEFEEKMRRKTYTMKLKETHAYSKKSNT